MHGQQQIIAMRRRGHRPKAVMLFDDSPARPSRLDREIPPLDVLSVSRDDSPQLLDLRCLVGLRVHVMAHDPRRFDALVAACTEAGAARVLGSLHDPRTNAVLRMTDTDGAFVLGPAGAN